MIFKHGSQFIPSFERIRFFIRFLDCFYKISIDASFLFRYYKYELKQLSFNTVPKNNAYNSRALFFLL